MSTTDDQRAGRWGDLLAITARIDQHGAVAAECAALTGGTPDADGVAGCTTVGRIHRAAYVHRGLRMLAVADDFDALRKRIRDDVGPTLDADRFRIDLHDPAGRSPVNSVEAAVAIADVLDDFPDLSTPLHRFVVVAGLDQWAFGEVVAEADGSYRQHDAKPWTTSASLDARFSRALVNLVPDARSILDPCCGAGSIVLEAASLGLTAYGVDRQPAMVGMTRVNLAHFGYDASVVRADSRVHEQRADAVVTDLPYGNAIESDDGEIRAILERCAAQAHLGVFVAPVDISTWLAPAGYADIEVHTVLKRRGFTRWIHVARSRSVPGPG